MPPQPGAIQVTDRLDRRIRKPIDLLRCITSGIEIIVLAAAGVAASATTTGVETDIVGASGRLHTLLVVARPLVLFAILIIPVALAVRQLFRRQVQRLAEAVATGVLAAVVAAVTQRRAAARGRGSALRRDHHVPPGRQPRRGAGSVPGRPGGLRDDHRPVRPAGLAERPVAGRRRLRARPSGRPGHHRPVVPDHAARRAHDRPGRPVRGGQPVAAAQRGGDRDRAEQRGPEGDRDGPAPLGTADP